MMIDISIKVIMASDPNAPGYFRFFRITRGRNMFERFMTIVLFLIPYSPLLVIAYQGVMYIKYGDTVPPALEDDYMDADVDVYEFVLLQGDGEAVATPGDPTQLQFVYNQAEVVRLIKLYHDL